ncbi:MAG: hypothetical protein N3D71_00960 [Burkholderiaceae bacterium]|jgi:hypothetical protein|nr:hypothetical protein [Burkholderiaceae bacterium]
MNLRARTRFRTTLFALCALLLAQWSLASHACPFYAALGHSIETAAANAPAAQSDCGCDEGDASTICVKHCAGEKQATAQPAFAAAPPTATAWWASDLLPPASPQRALRCDLAQPHAPPLTILYCVSLT